MRAIITTPGLAALLILLAVIALSGCGKRAHQTIGMPVPYPIPPPVKTPAPPPLVTLDLSPSKTLPVMPKKSTVEQHTLGQQFVGTWQAFAGELAGRHMPIANDWLRLLIVAHGSAFAITTSNSHDLAGHLDGESLIFQEKEPDGRLAHIALSLEEKGTLSADLVKGDTEIIYHFKRIAPTPSDGNTPR